MEAREARGQLIAATGGIVSTPVGWKVPSQSGNGSYVVNINGDKFCTCPDFDTRQQPCKHIFAVEIIQKREEQPDGSTVATRTVRVTYSQNWPKYNAAQTHEQEHFVRLLRELCDLVPQPPQTFGRPRLPLSDVTFGIAFKVYSTMSGRRVMSDLRDAHGKGLLGKLPSFTSGFRYLEDPALTPILKALIEQSAMPLRAIETDFAVDSSGFSTAVYDRWYDAKYGKSRSEAKWVKAHLMCGTTTHVVTSVEITPTETGDAPMFQPLVESTAKRFAISEVSADKAYSSRKNLKVVHHLGGAAYIPFKARTTGEGRPYDTLWKRMWHYYQFNRTDFLEHYHKRSNVETAYSMIKAKFGGSVRAKTPVAQVNEVLAKVLCHNICVLIQSIYELGIAATFGTELAAVPEVAA